LRYVEVEPITRQEAEVAFSSAVSGEIRSALIRLVYHDPDWRWLQEKCIEMSKASDSEVAGLAVTCLGHLARIHRTLDLERVLPILKKLLGNPKISGRVEDALDDIETYLDVKVERSTN
jgi:hypothetical protein